MIEKYLIVWTIHSS